MHLRTRIIISSVLLAGRMAALRGADTVDYTRQVKPIFVQYCVKCHGADQPQSGLRLDSVSAMRRGGVSGIN